MNTPLDATRNGARCLDAANGLRIIILDKPSASAGIRRSHFRVGLDQSLSNKSRLGRLKVFKLRRPIKLCLLTETPSPSIMALGAIFVALGLAIFVHTTVEAIKCKKFDNGSSCLISLLH